MEIFKLEYEYSVVEMLYSRVRPEPSWCYLLRGTDAFSTAFQAALCSLNEMVAAVCQDISGVSGNGFPLWRLQ